MALYDYKCTKCGEIQQDVQHGMLETPEVKCEKCGAACTKMIGHSSFILKGSSWSRDGYK